MFSDVCTLRFDFESFTTAGPTATDDSTTCVDTFQVTAVRFLPKAKKKGYFAPSWVFSGQPFVSKSVGSCFTPEIQYLIQVVHFSLPFEACINL